jgi:hypothetical protein
MHKNATKCNETLRKWCKNKHGASKIIDTFETYQWEPQVGDMVYLRVSPMKGVHHFGVKGKLSPRYTGPFKILSQSRGVAFELELPKQLSKVHNVFHASQL